MGDFTSCSSCEGKQEQAAKNWWQRCSMLTEERKTCQSGPNGPEDHQKLKDFWIVKVSNLYFSLFFSLFPRRSQLHHAFSGKLSFILLLIGLSLLWCLPNLDSADARGVGGVERVLNSRQHQGEPSRLPSRQSGAKYTFMSAVQAHSTRTNRLQRLCRLFETTKQCWLDQFITP